MHIALNAQLLRLEEGYRSAGIAQYMTQLLRALDTAQLDLDLDVFCSDPAAPSLLPRARIHPTRFPAHNPLGRILWEQTAFPLSLARTKFDLIHSLAYVSPVLNRIPSVVTVYDLSFLLYPQYFKTLNRIYLQWGTQSAVSRARRVIAISASTKQDLMRLLRVPEHKIDVIPPGVDPAFLANRDPNAIERFRNAKRLPDRFVLFVGTREPRKNLPTLVRAFAHAKYSASLPHALVIAGGRGWKDHETSRAVTNSGLGHAVLFPGYVPANELPLWYRAADAFIYPSQYEGFGLPVLEALASGTPTITSNVSAMPEAAGEAAIMVSPQDEDEMADALLKVLTNRSARAIVRERGRAHARQFTWARAAQLTAETYRRALGQPEAH